MAQNNPLRSADSAFRNEELFENTWVNELGSQLVLEGAGKGVLKGTYCSGAGVVAGAVYPVVGAYDPSPWGSFQVLGFVVDWTDVHAVTVWSGHYDRHDRTVRATWLMTAESEARDEWKSTVTGHDIFRPIPERTRVPREAGA
jgi:hypothetical protein